MIRARQGRASPQAEFNRQVARDYRQLNGKFPDRIRHAGFEWFHCGDGVYCARHAPGKPVRRAEVRDR